MATATGTPQKPASDDQRIYHPLEQLRGIIRKYVLIEGVLSVLLFFVAWFTIALALDYGIFKAFTWDWVHDGSYGLRVAALVLAVGLLVGILVFRIAQRLLKEFSHAALALVLERRFPKILGDRLITAVELADVEDQAKYGYSAAMIRQTINEARERVGQVPVRDVFNWRRLRVMTIILVVWVLGLIGVGFAAHAISARGFQPTHAAWKSYHVASILAERDLFLMDTPWPRRALIELQGVGPEGIRSPQNGPAPQVKVKAYRWVIADRSDDNGWRAMRWSDVTESLVGVPVPELPNISRMRDASSVPVDTILEDEAVRGELSTAMGSEQYEKLQKVFNSLEDLAAKPSMGRKLRKLDAPRGVFLSHADLPEGRPIELQPQGSNEYAGEVTNLKRDVPVTVFTVRAEDFRTPERGITLVPPPVLMNIRKEEYQPAYLHYASPMVPDPNDPSKLVRGAWSDLKGLRQRVPDEKFSPGGDKTIIVVPVGSELVLTGMTERPIAEATVIPKRGRIPGGKVKIVDGKELRSDEPVPIAVSTVEEQEGDRTVKRGTFTIEFKGDYRITELDGVEFEFHFKNSDGIESDRKVLIQVSEDQTPIVEVLPEYIRKVGKEYWVTPRAKLPFHAESNLRDDSGLSKVAYTVSYEPTTAKLIRRLKFGQVATKIAVPVFLGSFVEVGFAVDTLGKELRSDQATATQQASFGMAQFSDPNNGLDSKLDRKTLAHIKSLLSVPTTTAKPELVSRVNLSTKLRQGVGDDKYRWDIIGDYFDVKTLKLETPQGDTQPQYDLFLTLEATDTNYDTGPRVGRNEPIPFLVVSDSDLLVEMGKDEERLLLKIEEALKRVESAKVKYEFVRTKAERQIADELEAVKVRSKDAWQDVQKARDTMQAVAREFGRLREESIYNQLSDKTIEDNGKFWNRLDRLLGGAPAFASEDEERRWNSASANNGGLRPESTFPIVDKLMASGQSDYEQGRWPNIGLVTDASIELYKLEQELTKIRNEKGEVTSKEKVINLTMKLIGEQRRVREAIRDWQNDIQIKATKDTPDLGPAGPVFMAKGETRKVRQTIAWRQFKEDVLPVKVVASDPSIIVPAELKLDFEKNDIAFEYEVRSGTKEGDFTITLTPVVGPNVKSKVTPVVVQISVK